MTHTRNSCSAINPSTSAHTQQWTHTRSSGQHSCQVRLLHATLGFFFCKVAVSVCAGVFWSLNNIWIAYLNRSSTNKTFSAQTNKTIWGEFRVWGGGGSSEWPINIFLISKKTKQHKQHFLWHKPVQMKHKQKIILGEFGACVAHEFGGLVWRHCL